MRYRAVISYFGARYVGWQRQLNGLSVQEVFEKALEKLSARKPPQPQAVARTQAFTQRDKSCISTQTLRSPSTRFLCRQHASSGRREHAFLRSRIRRFQRAFQCKTQDLLLQNVYLETSPSRARTHARTYHRARRSRQNQRGVQIIEGTHDFKCFEASGSIIKNTVRTIYSIEVETAPLQTYSSEDSATEKTDC